METFDIWNIILIWFWLIGKKLINSELNIKLQITKAKIEIVF